MGWKQDYRGLVEDLRHCHWEDFTEEKFQEIAVDLKRTLKMYGHVDYSIFPPTFRWHLCSARLTQGKFNNWDGWEYRSNWSITFQGWNGFQMKTPKWDGKPVKKLIISSEQGIGDEILYASAIPELMVRLGPKSLQLQCHPRLIPVFERSFGIECIPRKVLSEIEGGAVVALADLFMFYRKDKSHFPKKPFLKVDQKTQDYWKERLSSFPKPWIGIGWKSRHGQIDPERLISKVGTEFNLQYGEKHPGLIEFAPDPLEDMDGHLAFVSCMDNVISVTQTLVHEAGCLGVPCETIKPPKGTGEVDHHLWYYGKGKSPHGHHVYGAVTVFESESDYEAFHKKP